MFGVVTGRLCSNFCCKKPPETLILIKLLQKRPAGNPSRQMLDCASAINSMLSPAMAVAARTIIELNIQHYRELLKTESDPSTRRTIAKLLAEEVAKLEKLPVEKKERK